MLLHDNSPWFCYVNCGLIINEEMHAWKCAFKNLYKVFLSLKDEPIWLGMWSFCEWTITEELLSII